MTIFLLPIRGGEGLGGKSYMEFVKDRSLAEGSIVRVYLNWNKGFSVFSIVDHKSGLVVAYSESVTLRTSRLRCTSAAWKNVESTNGKMFTLGFWGSTW